MGRLMGALIHTACPWCNTEQDEHDGKTEDVRPKPGDVSFCSVCLGGSVFVQSATGLTTRRANRAEMQRMLQNPEIYGALHALASHLGRSVDEAIATWRNDGEETP